MTPPSFGLSPQQSHLLGLAVERPLVSQCAVVVDDALGADALRAALGTFVARHETLRTTFVRASGSRVPVGQAIHERLDPVLAAETRDDEALLRDRAELDALLEREAAAGLDPEHGPTMRLLLVALPHARSLLVLSALAACADLSSLLILADELSGAPTPAVDPIQHADYAEWRAELLAGDGPDAASGRRFWREAIDALEQAPPLLFGSPAEAAAATRKERVRTRLDEGALATLQARASATGVDAGLLVEAAWHALLGRHSGRAELITAGSADGRLQPDLEGAVGPYAQTIPIQVRIEPETGFAEVLDQVRRARARALRWQEYASSADLARLGECAVAGFATTDGGGWRASDGPQRSLASLSPVASPCPLQLAWRDDGEIELWYAPAVYDRRDADDLVAQLAGVVVASAADPLLAVGELPLLDGEARAEVLTVGAGPEVARAPSCLHLDFEEQVARSPEATAVTVAGEGLTFRELNERANRLAHHLRALGVARDAPVGLCMTRSAEVVTALLGIMKAGGGYLPLNSTHPPARLAHQVAEAGAGVVVTHAPVRDLLAPLPVAAVVCLDEEATEIAARPSANLPLTNEPEDLAYVMYTSGSTGLPKGVAVTHANLTNYTHAIVAQLGAEEPLHFAVVTEISTDLGNTGVFPPLVTGGCIHLIGPEASMDGEALAAYVEEHPIDVLKISPTHLRALLGASTGVLPRRWLVSGGEALSWDLVEQVRRGPAGCRILNHYGPTETTIGCCTGEVATGDAGPSRPRVVPIGRPIANTRAYVVDRRLEPVPVGVVGELCVAGAGVARGYVNRPEETAARFVPDPAAPAGDGRMYRTGDRARFLRDGTIEFQGRIDQQVKVRGYRVEPEEVESALVRHPAIREAAVVVGEDGHGDAQLIAYVVGSPPPASADLKRFLGESLPDYMVPARYAAVGALPRTPSGKVDRRALPDPASVEVERGARYTAPRDELEDAIAAIWAELLGVERVGIFDDFFALGGQSLLATQAIMRIRRSYGDVPIGALFGAPTVAALAEVIRGRAAATTPAAPASAAAEAAPRAAGIVTRAGGPEDAGLIAEIRAEGQEDYRAWAPAGWSPPTHDEQALGRLAATLARPDVWCVVAQVDGAAVGHAALAPFTPFEGESPPPGAIILWHLFVRRNWQGRGVAPLLEDETLAEARRRGFAQVRFWTPTGATRARRFFEREGWRSTGEVRDEPALGLPVTEYVYSLVDA